jgi:hypothetical protein
MQIIRLKSCSNAFEAKMLKDILDNEGIECFLTNENFTSVFPVFNGMYGTGIQLMIKEEDYEKASKLIEQIEGQ